MSVKEVIRLICAADNRFPMQAACMLKSAICNLDSGYELEVYLITEDLSADNQRRIASSCDDARLRLNVQIADPSKFKHAYVCDSLSAATFYRLTIADFLPEDIAKVIYLDSDLIVHRSLSELWSEPLGDHLLLAAQDLAFPNLRRLQLVLDTRGHDVDLDAPCFNAGVMVINVEAWRKQDIASPVLQFCSERPCTDQDALNVICGRRWRKLDPRWNQIFSVCNQRFNKVPHLPPETARAISSSPWISHFAGRLKPWTCYFDEPIFLEYYKYLDRTDWSGWRPETTLKGSFYKFYFSYLRRYFYELEYYWWAICRRWSTRRLS